MDIYGVRWGKVQLLYLGSSMAGIQSGPVPNFITQLQYN